MKKIFAFLLICTSILATPFQDHQIPHAALVELLKVFDIKDDDQIIAETQKKWLRRGGKERWEMDELSQDKKQFVLEWSKKQGLFDSWKPTQKHYDRALILGATTSRMQSRLAFLKKLYEEGIRFKQVVWLTGERPLDPKGDELLDICKTEFDAAKYIWGKANLPAEMRILPAEFVTSPMKTVDGVSKRPTTEDTLLDWLKTNPPASSLLFISDQPFCGYQFAVIKSVLPPSFKFDVAGKEADPTNHPAAAAITLDAIARWIYQEKQSAAN